jgi:nitrate/TMAO reductase-like tetraheme cytochrome c subunit
MYRNIAIVILLMAAPMLFSQTNDADKKPNSYVGAEMCGMCHKSEKAGKQFDIWKASKHSQAYQTLLTTTADSIAKSRGSKTAAVKTEECLSCHVPTTNVDASLIGAKYKIEDGIQCETCHGPGSNYKAISVMKNKDLAVTNGLMIVTNLETFCVKCHNDKSPTYVKQDVNVMWAKIKHTIPQSK